MSSILKALKRLEEEQTGRAASSSAGSHGQFVAPMRAGQPLLLLILGVGAGLLVAGGLYAAFGRSGISNASPVVQEQKVDVAATLSAPIVETIRVASASSMAPVQSAVSVPATPAQTIVPVLSQPAAKTVSAKPEMRSQTEILSPARSEPRALAETRGDPVEPMQIEHREIPAPGQQWAAPHLTVSDILPAAGGGRMAIVNGMPVMEGTMIDEVLVENIGENQVVFVVEGRTVTVPLVQPKP
jgi:hypothetical protein